MLMPLVELFIPPCCVDMVYMLALTNGIKLMCLLIQQHHNHILPVDEKYMDGCIWFYCVFPFTTHEKYRALRFNEIIIIYLQKFST